jgi:hypothetical protein
MPRDGGNGGWLWLGKHAVSVNAVPPASARTNRFAAPPYTAVVELELTETVLMGATQRHRASFGSAAGLAFRLMHGRIITDAIRAECGRRRYRRSG